jgi:hypothetical protein
MARKINVGTKDANYRTLAAAVLVLVTFFFIENPYLRIVLATIAAVLAGTAFLRTCPLYTYLGRNTCEPVSPTEANPVAESAHEPVPPVGDSSSTTH